MKKGGWTVRELNEGIDRCIGHCLATNEAPVGFVLHKFLDIPEDVLSEYLAQGEQMRRGEIKKTPGMWDRYLAARRWEEFKTFFWLKRAQEDPKNASFAMFNLKQSENGGYGGREDGGGSVVVRLEGVGGPEAMK